MQSDTMDFYNLNKTLVCAYCTNLEKHQKIVTCARACGDGRSENSKHGCLCLKCYQLPFTPKYMLAQTKVAR